AMLLLIAAVVLAWSNSFTAPFAFDDYSSIVENQTIRNLGSLDWMHPPATAGETVTGRPVLNFTFAVNYAMGGPDVRGYHAINLAIHLLAALTLYGIVRRTLGRAKPPAEPASPEASARDSTFASAVALLWALHPLQTESVTYIVQRAESLAGLFSLLTLYGFVRGTQEKNSARWYLLSVVSCLLGVGTKETVAVMPLVVLLYDLVFFRSTLRAAWQARGRIHVALWATWVPLAALVLGTGGKRGGTFAFTVEAFWNYWVAQLKAVTVYLGLVVWPNPLVLDRPFFRIEHLTEALPYAVLIFALVAAAAWGLWKRTAPGFAGAFFFIVLAPSSLMPGLLQVIVEHRMYLALAAPILLLLAAARKFLPPKVALTLVAVAAVALGATTFARNRVYGSELTLWRDAVEKSPGNSRAYYNLGLALRHAGRTDEAVIEFEHAIALRPEHAYAHFQLGMIRFDARDWRGAAAQFEAAVAADPHYVAAHINLGNALLQLGDSAAAMNHYQAALADEPGAVDARTNLAGLLIGEGRTAEASAMLREVVAAAPELAEAHYQLGRALESSDPAAAEAEYREAVRLKPSYARGHLALGNLLARRGDSTGAETALRTAIQLDGTSAEARFALGNLLVKQQRFDLAMTAFREAVTLDPSHVQARANLANCQLMSGDVDAAIANYEQALQARPGDAALQRNLALARELRDRRAGRR
ncbi:MAG TPA: tetratricopeptide repeat protein, partial [Candidatus Didemnitutus sp.]|nr:tetratricopeptide repeat protein [Candidatus Didemnitutus sp.]